MPVDKTSGDFTVKQRDADRDDWLTDFKFRIPSADIGKDSQPFKDASVNADTNAPIYANCSIIADGTSWGTSKGAALTKHALEIGRPRKDAVGGLGYVIIEAASGGGAILAGTEIRYVAGGVRFATVTGGSYVAGDLCAVQGIDTGAQTNVAAGTVLQWVSPPAGILGTARVFENADGSGISGGAAEESDDELVEAIGEIYAEPASSGNDADVIQFVQGLTGIAIQKAFCIPCVEGPGEYCVMFTMRPASPGTSRIPNGAHIARVDAELRAAFPADDGIFTVTILEDRYAVCVEAEWLEDVSSWADLAPWPPYNVTKVVVSGAVPATASTARLSNCTVAPSVGKNIAFYDSVSTSFKVKRILTAVLSAGTTYNVTFNMTGNASDASFVPAAGAIVSPWSANMSSLVAPLLVYGDRQGPGEMVANVGIEAGRRQRRIPTSTPTSWPHEVGQSILDDLFELTKNVELLEPATPFATALGTPGVNVWLHRISDIGIFAA